MSMLQRLMRMLCSHTAPDNKLLSQIRTAFAGTLIVIYRPLPFKLL
jgi:hypothetical protein